LDASFIILFAYYKKQYILYYNILHYITLIYNCDLSATYNIGARYFIREILKSLLETARLQLEAKVPQVCKRSTCTLSTLISLDAALKSA